jgi:hypothetical protein
VGIPPLLTDQLTGVIWMRLDGEGRAVFGCDGLDAEEFRLVDQCTDNLV